MRPSFHGSPCPQRLASFAAAVATLLSASACEVNTPPDVPNDVIPAQTRRVAFLSRCGQNVIDCTSSWPTPVIRVEAREGQTVAVGDGAFSVRDPTTVGFARVQLIGSDSEPGEGATDLSFSWSFGATDNDPCTLEPGAEFSTDPDPVVGLATGVHLIRLTVTNNIIRDRVESEECGLIGESIGSFDFLEVEITIEQ